MVERRLAAPPGAVDIQPDSPHHRPAMDRGVGFRLSGADALVLLAAGIATWLLWSPMRDLAVGVATAVFHFFLFCNVFRVRRRLELIWAGLLVANVLVFRWSGEFTWPRVLAVQTVFTLVVSVLTIVGPDYRGICGRRTPARRADATPPPPDSTSGDS